jgi:hypothetical protein
MRHTWVALCVVGLAGCSSPQQQAARALQQARGWGATAEALTSDQLAADFPRQFAARTLAAGAEAVEGHARTIDSLQDLPDDERRSSADSLRRLAATLHAAASGVQAGPLDAPIKAALIDA